MAAMSARIGRVAKFLWSRLRLMPAAGPVVQVKGAESDARDTEIWHPPGISSGATAEDAVVTVPVRAGYRVAVASHNYRVNVEVEPGQTRVYSTPADGSAVMAEVDMLPDGQLTVKNDAGAEVVLHTDGLLEQKNDSQSLKTLIDSVIDELVAFKTFGSPTQHATDPGTVTNLQAIKAKFGQLLK